MAGPRVFADFGNADSEGRVRLNTRGTREDLSRLGMSLSESMRLTLTDYDEFEIEGVVSFSREEQIWVATIDWNVLGKKPPG